MVSILLIEPSCNLRSSDKARLVVPKSSLVTTAGLVFVINAPRLWNSLLEDLMLADLVTLRLFKILIVAAWSTCNSSFSGQLLFKLFSLTILVLFALVVLSDVYEHNFSFYLILLILVLCILHYSVSIILLLTYL